MASPAERVPVALVPQQQGQPEFKPFLVDRNLVTHQRYLEFVQATASAPPRTWKGRRPSEAQLLTPITGVSWEEARAFAQWAGGRLPTEKEWTLLAQGPRRRVYPWGDAYEPRYDPKVWQQPAASRMLPPMSHHAPWTNSVYGIHDLLLVWEWTSTPVHTGVGYVVCGGPWRDRKQPPTLEVRSFECEPALDVGFRCVYPFKPPTRSQPERSERLGKLFAGWETSSPEVQWHQALLETPDGRAAYISQQLHLVDTGSLGVVLRFVQGSPVFERVDETGFDTGWEIIEIGDALAVTHSNNSYGVYGTLARLISGTSCSFLRFSHTVPGMFEFADFIEQIIRSKPSNYESPT